MMSDSLKPVEKYAVELRYAKEELIVIERKYFCVKEEYEYAKRVVDALHMIVNPKAMRLRGGE